MYLATEANYFHVVDATGKSEVEERMENRDRKANPAVNVAILGKNKAITRPFLYLYLIFFFFFKLKKRCSQ